MSRQLTGSSSGGGASQAKYTRFVASDLDAAARYIETLHRRAADPAAAQKAAHKKYASPRFHSVSALPLPTSA